MGGHAVINLPTKVSHVSDKNRHGLHALSERVEIQESSFRAVVEFVRHGWGLTHDLSNKGKALSDANHLLDMLGSELTHLVFKILGGEG